MKKQQIKLIGISLFAAASLAMGQVAVETDPGYGNILQGKNTGSQNADGIAVYGESTPAPYYGIGVKGEGGYMGVFGISTLSGTGTRYGGYFIGSSATGTNYGVYASAYGGASNYAGYFSGDVYVSGTFTNPSDERLKRGIAPLSGSLNKVMALRPSSYYFDNSILPVKGLPKDKQFGLLAGDVESVFPELVHEVPIAAGDDKGENSSQETFRSVNYVGLIPVLVGAIKEQQAQIAALQAALNKK